VAQVVVLLMGGEAARQKELSSLVRAHELHVIEPRFPECKRELEAVTPMLVLVDGSRAPSHGRATAGWMAGLARLRTVPFLFLDVPDTDVPKVKQTLPRAQFGTWASVAGASERLLAGR
jgi:hypothetical protein